MEKEEGDYTVINATESNECVFLGAPYWKLLVKAWWITNKLGWKILISQSMVQITMKTLNVLKAQTKSLVAVAILWKWFICPKVIVQWILYLV